MSSPIRNEVVKQARLLVGTPYRHKMAKRGVGCDCIGVIVATGRAMGFKSMPTDREMPIYHRLPHDHVAQRTAEVYLSAVENPRWENIKPGQIGLFYWRDRGHGQHFCVFGRDDTLDRLTMIHAYQASGKKVCEIGATDFWRKRLVRLFDYREVAEGCE